MSKSKLSVKSALRSEFFAKVRETILASIYGNKHPTKVFSDIYKKNLWNNSESRSGRCSTIDATDVVRQQLPPLLKKYRVRTMLDAPCGDFNWMQHTKLALDKYTGADIVPDLIRRNRLAYTTQNLEFIVLDLTKDKIPAVDLIFCRDCLIHLSLKYMADAIEHFRESGSKYLLTTTYTLTRENKDILTGDVRFINLQIPPFNFPEPLDFIVEEPEHGKSLALWMIEDL